MQKLPFQQRQSSQMILKQPENFQPGMPGIGKIVSGKLLSKCAKDGVIVIIQHQCVCT